VVDPRSRTPESARPELRRLRSLDIAELALVGQYLRAGTLDPGESEMLAVAKHRGWVAVIDEMVGHCFADLEGIVNESTLSILVRGVRETRISEADGSAVWVSIQESWNYAPGGALTEYVQGRPIWPPCPESSR
jgi:hypothetical protein